MSSQSEHDNPIPMCLMSRLFVVTTHWRCLLLLRAELRRWGAGLVISPAPWELWEIGLWLGLLVRAQCHCDLCYVKWFDLSYDYLSIEFSRLNVPRMETFNSFSPSLDLGFYGPWASIFTKILCKSCFVSCTGFNWWIHLCHTEVSFLDVQYFDLDDMMSPASMKCLHQEREANVQCLPLAGRERPVSLCVSCQDPWDENNSEMRSYSVYNIIQHVTSSLVVTTRHKIFSLDH